MARIHLLLKYTFFALLVFGAGLAIARLSAITHYWVAEPYVADDLTYNGSALITSRNVNDVLKKKYLKCFTEPSKPFCLLSANKRLQVFRSNSTEILSMEEVENRLQNVTKELQSLKRRMQFLLETFTKFMEDIKLKVLVIEPSMLFCLLSTRKKFSMLSEDFNPGRLKGSKNVVTVGVMEEDSDKLEERNLTSEMLSVGFKIIKFRKWVGHYADKTFKTVHYLFILQDTAIHVVIFQQTKNYLWHAGLDQDSIDFEGLLFVHEEFFEKNLTSEMLSVGFKIIKFRKWVGHYADKTFKTVHYLFILQDTAIHVVIFQQTKNYLWHAGLDQDSIDFEGLLFVHEEFFEKFTFYPLNLGRSNISQIHVPSNIPYFMKEIESSKFVECATNSSNNVSIKHPYLTKEQLNTRTTIIFQELKTIFSPYMVFFWLWSNTLMGWYSECDMFRHTSSMDLAVSSKRVQDLNITELITNSEFLKLTDTNETDNKFILKFDCHGLSVNLYILHEEKDLLWYRLDGNTLKYPFFTLCSTQILSQKIYVPCNAADVLEYAQNTTTMDTSTFV